MSIDARTKSLAVEEARDRFQEAVWAAACAMEGNATAIFRVELPRYYVDAVWTLAPNHVEGPRIAKVARK